jgi:DNA primase
MWFSLIKLELRMSFRLLGLTPDQIRLIIGLQKYQCFWRDAAGLRASVRGIDLIPEEGMNVKVCTFPDGEDPDSFAKKTSTFIGLSGR